MARKRPPEPLDPPWADPRTWLHRYPEELTEEDWQWIDRQHTRVGLPPPSSRCPACRLKPPTCRPKGLGECFYDYHPLPAQPTGS